MNTQAKIKRVQQSEDETGIRKGPWSDEEDTILANCVTAHSDVSWNSIARSSGLKRSGKSCRLRWLNYLRPGVRHGNITLQEQITIIDLHSQWGNRWSKIAKHLPGRTDNEIKNYWRTRVIKQAKQLKCDVNSKQFKDVLRFVWMPLLTERIQPPSETYYPTQLDQNPCASAAPLLVHHQHDLQSSSSRSECLNHTYTISSNMELQVHSEQLGHNVSGQCPSFSNQMFEQGNSTLPLEGGGEDLMESLWNDENMWLMQQLCDDLEIK